MLSRKINLMFTESDYGAILDRALSMGSASILDAIEYSGLRGRGGAGFPTGRKWNAVAEAPGKSKIIICNADEGEPGTFKDREILEEQALKVLTGMMVCAIAVGADRGFIYLRHEYSYMISHIEKEIDRFQKLIEPRKLSFPIEMRMGSGAYICGEETALLESMEGKRGEARNKPPYPVDKGYLDFPTIINNVETFVYTTIIIEHGPEEFHNLGTKDSRGAKIFCVSGDTPKPGIYELEMGMNLEDFVRDFGDGDTKAVQVGGSSGYCVPRKLFTETIIGFEGIPTGGSMMLFNSSRSMYNILKGYLEFFCEESCGQCTPCRVGCQQLLKGLEAVKASEKPSSYLKRLNGLAGMMEISAKCGLGQSVAHPFKSITEHFTEEIVY
ncbi:NADH-ubiquinone oxidoreductase-F iron-sulfur binding region domain-containing protein [Spirochaeta isovalerica]|uniref:[NiFe] hydrogenase diaphorase moiety large subunit n=1 Tax=Spirochaeta isovalerica TaxID=150 RepID=A0A841R8W4_9SPIO|nr:NADH-ubiquinone oxidoreductase-F iron-sulfur binding region domain-containing protein [Spirochaeta isovalerica]MBB6480343.1 [NiFe] hydrogenase diaphorase moiety large subunit [Spirochaeta isovalerica]